MTSEPRPYCCALAEERGDEVAHAEVCRERPAEPVDDGLFPAPETRPHGGGAHL